MTITQEELQYIADHWLSHPIIHIHSWGISKKIANPETHLAMYRRFPFIEYMISDPRKTFPFVYSISPDERIKKHELAILQQDWYTFLEYEKFFDYKYDLLNNYARTVRNVINILLPYSSSYDRIYTLE